MPLYKIDSYKDWAAASPPTMVWVPAGLGPLSQGNGTTGPGRIHRRIKTSPVRTHRRTKDMSQPSEVSAPNYADGTLPSWCCYTYLPFRKSRVLLGTPVERVRSRRSLTHEGDRAYNSKFGVSTGPWGPRLPPISNKLGTSIRLFDRRDRHALWGGLLPGKRGSLLCSP